MKKTLLATAVAFTSTISLAEGPLTGGQRDIIFDIYSNSQSNNDSRSSLNDATAFGVRQALDSQKSVYLVVNDAWLGKERDYLYNAGTDTQDLDDTEKWSNFNLVGGGQYFLDESLFGFGEVGYYKYKYTYLVDATNTKTETKVGGLNFAFGAGFEHPLSEKLSLVVKSKFMVDNWTADRETIPAVGPSTPGNQQKGNNKGFIHTLGFTYNIDGMF